MAGFDFLHKLPEELLQQVLERLEKRHLQSLNLASRWCYQVATPLIWRSVDFVDCRTVHEQESIPGDDDTVGTDEHDDTPIIEKLLLIAQNPLIAASVQVITHRCHLPPPAIFNELPANPFNAQTLSTDPRTIRLAQIAVSRMTHVHTLRIILGHPNLTDALLRCFFDARRYLPGTGYSPVRKLWLENCLVGVGLDPRLDSHPYSLPVELRFDALESLRFRRLPVQADTRTEWLWVCVVYSRGGRYQELQDGRGDFYSTTVNNFQKESTVGQKHLEWLDLQRELRAHNLNLVQYGQATLPRDTDASPLEKMHQQAQRWDDLIYSKLASYLELPEEVQVLSSLSTYDRAVQAYSARRLAVANMPKIDSLGPEQRSISTSNAAAVAGGMPMVDAGSEAGNLGSQLQQPLVTSTSNNATVATAPMIDSGPEAGNLGSELQRLMSPPNATIRMLRQVGATLTSLTLDWILNSWFTLLGPQQLEDGSALYLDLFSCRFPHLRAFQFRNCVVPHSVLLPEFYLLDHSFCSPQNLLGAGSTSHIPHVRSMDLAALEFMEAHPKLQCLAWPMDRFFGPGRLASDIALRVQAVVNNLGRSLVDLRVDHLYSGNGERQSEEWFCHDHAARASRRNFITEFAAKMTKVESIKVEGGVPRDERREVVRALHRCPLRKIVMIGVCSPLGNTWGLHGMDVADPYALPDSEFEGLEAEDDAAVNEIGPTKPSPPPPDFKYSPCYGWEGQAPMLHALASYHSSTITELKFCGYKGAPILFAPTPITHPLYTALKNLHNLESIIMSMFLPTVFEGAMRDSEIIAYWDNSRSPASTALVRISDEEPEGWEKELRTKFAPDALAWRVTNFVGPLLSDVAKRRKGGVHVRASFCIGESGGLFDVDLWVGKGVLDSDVCLGFVGPREELEEERRVGKLENRRWF